MRSLDLAEGLLECDGRKTITAMIRGAGRDQQDWSADYRFFSEAQWELPALSRALIREVTDVIDPSHPFVAAVDDTICRKSGFQIPGVSYRRDPMSPPFHVNFIPGQRFIQLSMMVPHDNPGPARAVPVCFEHVPTIDKLPKKATEEQKKEYRKAQRHNALANHGVRVISDARKQLDEGEGASRQLIVGVDNSYTNEKVLKHLPERVTLIGRVRKDTKFFFAPEDHPGVGRPRTYGERAPTPEEVRTDESIPWQKVKAFATGRVHSFRVKSLPLLYWRKAGVDRPLRLVVIAPLSYRLRKDSRILYRKSAFLICTDPELPLESLIQYYVWRWDIEQNHRDEKQLFGVGQAQVRSPKSAARVPAFVVACYATLLLAAIRTYGKATEIDDLFLSKWQKRPSKKRARIPTAHILNKARIDLARTGPPINFNHFETRVAAALKLPKSHFSLEEALSIAMN